MRRRRAVDRRSGGSPASSGPHPRSSSLVARPADRWDGWPGSRTREHRADGTIGPIAHQRALGLGQPADRDRPGRVGGGGRAERPAQGSRPGTPRSPADSSRPRTARCGRRRQPGAARPAAGRPARRSRRGQQPLGVGSGDHPIELAVDEQDRPAVAGDRLEPALMSSTRWPRWRTNSRVVSQLSGTGDRGWEGQVGQPERLAHEPARIGRRGRADQGRHPRVGRGRQDRPDGPHRVAEDRPDGDLRPGDQRGEGRPASAPNSPALTGSVSAGLAPWPRTSKARQWKPGRVQELDVAEHPVAGRIPAVDKDDPGPRDATVGRDEPGRQVASGRADDRRSRRPIRSRTGRTAAAGDGGTRPASR